MAAAVQFDEKTHTYTIGATRYPSVTEIIESFGLLPAYPSAQREYYLARGAATHLCTALYDQGKLKQADERLLGYLEGWKAFRRDSAFEPELIEHRVASAAWRYAGTLDRYGKMGKDKAIVDIKSGAVAACTALQTAAYKKALLEHDDLHADRRFGVSVYSDGRYKVTEFISHSDDDRLFLAAVSLYHWKTRNL